METMRRSPGAWPRQPTDRELLSTIATEAAAEQEFRGHSPSLVTDVAIAELRSRHAPGDGFDVDEQVRIATEAGRALATEH